MGSDFKPETSSSPLPLASGTEQPGRDGPQPSLNHAGGMIDPVDPSHWVGGGLPASISGTLVDSASPPLSPLPQAGGEEEGFLCP